MSLLAALTAVGTGLAVGGVSWRLLSLRYQRKTVDLQVSVNRTRAFLAARNTELLELAEENHRLEYANDGLKRQNISVMRTFEDLLEPTRIGTCTKVQLQNKPDAEAFARKVEQDTKTGAMTVYKCPICPRHPVTGDRIFHITHVERAKQGKTWDKRQTPTSIRKRVSPEDLAALRAKTGGAA